MRGLLLRVKYEYNFKLLKVVMPYMNGESCYYSLTKNMISQINAKSENGLMHIKPLIKMVSKQKK